MRKTKTLMVTTAALALIASAAFVNAQTGKAGESGTSSAGPEQHSGGASGGVTKPTQGSTEQKGGSQHMGQSVPGAKSPERMGEESGKGSAQHPAVGNAESHDKAGQADTKERGGQTERKGRSATDVEQNKERAGRDETKEPTGENRERTGKSQMSGAGKGGSVHLSQEQHTKIHEVITHDRTAVVDHVDFSVSVGTAVPRSIRVYDVPVDIVDIVPEYRGFRYFIVRDEVVIVDPETLEIVAIIPA
jgi:Protein of unknown function (DUF1236)